MITTALFIIVCFMVGLAIYIEIVDKRSLARMAQECKAREQQS